MNQNTPDRSNKRIPISIPISYTYEDPVSKKILKIKAVTKDISPHGFCFTASHTPKSPFLNFTIELKSPYETTTNTRKTSLTLKAKIIHAHPVSEDDSDILNTGACFVELTEEDDRLLREFIQKHNPSP